MVLLRDMPCRATLRRTRQPRRGVTNIAILGFLATAAFASYLFAERHQALPPDSPEQIRAKIETVRSLIDSQMSVMLTSYQKQTGSFPATADGVWALIESPPRIKGWTGPYLTKPAMPIDPWGQVYQYAFPGSHNGPGKFDIWSNGPDGLSGTADDIGNW